MSTKVIYIKDYHSQNGRASATVKTKHTFLFWTWYKERELLFNGVYWEDEFMNHAGYPLSDRIKDMIALGEYYARVDR